MKWIIRYISTFETSIVRFSVVFWFIFSTVTYSQMNQQQSLYGQSFQNSFSYVRF